MDENESLDGAHDSDEMVTIQGAPDIMLLAVVATVEGNDADDGDGMEVGLTISLRGQVITGTLISRARWFTALLKAAPSQSGQALIGGIQQAMDEVYDPDGPISFLHLRDGRLISGGTPTGGKGGHWRCAIGEVDGWCFGEIQEA